MSFERIGFASLFHDAFTIDSPALTNYLTLENLIRPYVEKVLLTRLALGGSRPPRPRVSPAEVEARFDAMRVELDYLEAERTSRFLDECGLTLEDVDSAIAGRLAVEKIVDRFIAGLQRDRSGRDAVCREAFLDLDLRAHAIRAIALGLLGGDGTSAAVDDRALAAAREHLQQRHGSGDWTTLLTRFTRTWRIPESEVDRHVRVYAAALTATRPAAGEPDAR